MEQVLAQKNLFFSSKWESRTVQQIILGSFSFFAEACRSSIRQKRLKKPVRE
jgi:hypothetical protein